MLVCDSMTLTCGIPKKPNQHQCDQQRSIPLSMMFLALSGSPKLRVTHVGKCSLWKMPPTYFSTLEPSETHQRASEFCAPTAQTSQAGLTWCLRSKHQRSCRLVKCLAFHHLAWFHHLFLGIKRSTVFLSIISSLSFIDNPILVKHGYTSRMKYDVFETIWEIHIFIYVDVHKHCNITSKNGSCAFLCNHLRSDLLSFHFRVCIYIYIYSVCIYSIDIYILIFPYMEVSMEVSSNHPEFDQESPIVSQLRDDHRIWFDTQLLLQVGRRLHWSWIVNPCWIHGKFMETCGVNILCKCVLCVSKICM